MRALQPSQFSKIVADLASPADLRRLGLHELNLIMGIRHCALFDQVGREPIAELSTKFGSVPAALAVLDLARTISRVWPEPFVVGRPCCMRLTPDEVTLAGLGVAGRKVDRLAFRRQIEGLVRSSRYDQLFDACLRCMAAFAHIA